MIPMLQLSVRSQFRIYFRSRVAWEDKNPFKHPPRYRLELCGFNADRWRRLYGREQFGNGLAEIFSNP